MDLPGRIKYIMKVNRLSASAFAEKIGVQRSSISHILSGRNKPSLDFITKVLEAFPRVNAEWLITGNTEVSGNKMEGPSPSDTSQPSGGVKKPQQEGSGKSVKKILIFFSDNSFEEFFPAS